MKLSEIIQELAYKITEEGDTELEDDFIIRYKYGTLHIDQRRSRMKAEKFIKDYTKYCSNELIFTTEEDKTCKEYSPWLTPEQALSAVKIAREEVIEKACKWLREHRDYVETEDCCISGWIPESFIEDFKEYMNENS